MAVDKTVLELIMDALKLKSINTFAPSTHVGACTSPYVVVRSSGASQKETFSSQVQYYTLYCYVPQQAYTSLDRLADSCKEALVSLEPMIKPTGYETPSFYDDTVKAHMISIQYRNYKRNTSL